MHRRDLSWVSPALARPMHLAAWGHWGKPLLLFPTATADHLDVERFGMIEALRPMIEGGALKVYSIESPNTFSWMDRRVTPDRCIQVQDAYNSYVCDEVVPFVREDCRTPDLRIAVAGASFGCFHAGNQFFRRPDLFDTLVGMSGTYDLSAWSRGYFDEACYLNSPVHFLHGLRGPLLRLLKKRSFIRLVSWRRRESPRPARHLARVLRRKRIPYKVDVWKKGTHDWWWWNRQLRHHLEDLAPRWWSDAAG